MALLAAGAASVDVALTHALFAGDALAVIRHAIAMAPVLAEALAALM